MSVFNAFMSALRANNSDTLKAAKSLLEDALNDGAFEKSLKNCHHKGMDSVVLFDETETNGGMARFFYARHGQHAMNSVFDKKGHFTLGMHNHRFDLQIVPLVGSIVNIETKESHRRTGITLHEYAFASALADDDIEAVGTVHRRAANFAPLDERPLHPGNRLSMRSDQIHTVLVPDTVRTPGTAWLVIEGPDTGTASRIYSPRDDLTVTSTDLYTPMSRSEALGLTEWVHSAVVSG